MRFKCVIPIATPVHVLMATIQALGEISPPEAEMQD